jgi:lipopolysaccharide assembly outer membrane protein LptD (OstA)
MRRTIGCVAFLCALFVWPAAAAAQDNPFGSCGPDDPVRFQGNLSEPIAGRPAAFRITLIGPVSIVCNDLRLSADEVVYDTDTRAIVATGNVALEQPELRVFAERAELDGQTKLGTFYVATGTASIGNAPPESSMIGTQEPDVMFHARELARIAPTTYSIRDGAFSTCAQPTARWEMSGSQGTIRMDRFVLMRHVVFRVKNVPPLYLPAMYYPII